MKMTTIKSEEMTTPECSNKHLMVSSALWLNVLILLVLFLIVPVGLTVLFKSQEEQMFIVFD